MRKILAICLSLILMLSLCVGCGSSGSDSASDDSNGVLTVGMDAEPTTLDPGELTFENGLYISMFLYDVLWYQPYGSNDLEYRLATGYEWTDELELTITLRDGCTFSNGEPIDAEAVLASLARAAESISGSSRVQNIDFSSSYAADDTTVVLVLSYYDACTIENLGNGGAAIVDVNCTDYTAPVCSGPYIVGSFATGEGLVMVKNENYWDAANIVYDEIDVEYLSDETTRLLEFENGTYDLVFLTDSGNIEEVSALDGVTTAKLNTQSITGINLNVTQSDVLADQNVRLAIAYAIDKESIVNLYCGSAYNVADSILPSTNWAYQPMNYTYDPELAAEYLAAAGYDESNRFSFTARIIDVGANMEIATAIQAYLAEIGIDMAIDSGDTMSVISDMIAGNVVFGLQTYTGVSDPAGVLNARVSTAFADMSKFYSETTGKGDAAIQQLLDDAEFIQMDEAERGSYYISLQAACAEFCSFIPLYEGFSFYAVQNGVADVTASCTSEGFLTGYHLG
ncbi:MAG: ABC transporter substrate-binding protein [Oscillospiraceae bacterium]|nr:ABC transporter substrate-binding protein [Oscillospiraceae bacterium]